MKIYEIKCKFCGIKTGEFSFDIPESEIITSDMVDFADSRCENCEQLHGSYPEMSKFIDKVIGKDKHDKIMDECEAKIDKLINKILIEYPEESITMSNNFPSIDSKIDAKMIAIGINDVTKIEQVEILKQYKEANKNDNEIDANKIDIIKADVVDVVVENI